MSIFVLADRVTQFREKFMRLTLSLPQSNLLAGYELAEKHEEYLSERLSELSLRALHGVDAREIVLSYCKQTEPIAFESCYNNRTLEKCHKIGEGISGEVFLQKTPEGRTVVLKVIPIEGPELVNGEPQKKFDEIVSEMIISSELSNLRKNRRYCTNGFVEVNNVRCVRGRYPTRLLELWDLYDESRGSENDSPSMFGPNQLYIVYELENAGQDLEAFNFRSAEQAYATFMQVTHALAVAERAFEFEHRDLHWGNILINYTDDALISYHLDGRRLEVPTRGVKASIIDYTLSRMTYNSCCIFSDLANDVDLFSATGDYQFDVYRLMQKKNLNDWKHFEPYTNVLWLDYILDKTIKELRYIRTNTKIHKRFIEKLKKVRQTLLGFKSALEIVNSGILQ